MSAALEILNPVAIARQFGGLLKRPWVRTVLLTVSIEGFLFFAAFAFAGNEIHHRFGLSFTMVGLALTAFGAGGMSYALFARHFVRLLGERGHFGGRMRRVDAGQAEDVQVLVVVLE